MQIGMKRLNFVDLVHLNNRTKLAKLITIEPHDVHIGRQNSSTSGKILSPVRFVAYDGGGFGTIDQPLVNCSNNLEVKITDTIEDINSIDIFYFHMNAPEKIKYAKGSKKRQSFMVYTMESEVHSFGGESWSNADFRMWYNLDLSFPEPATYFNVKTHLIDLLSSPKVEFEQKETQSPIVWVVSNCAAFNGREKFIETLMNKISLDSYGGCLKNKFSHPSEHMKGNIELYSYYKFVVAIENSNCEDYVTEKLVHVVASGSIPIVAGKNNKPNYLKFLPKNSFINIYDYKSVDDLVKHLKKIESDKSEYEKYIWFKRSHNFTRETLAQMSREKLIETAKKALGYEENKQFFHGLVSKEKSENKLCKLARYLRDTPSEKIDLEIEKNRINRPAASEQYRVTFNTQSLN
ncbi:glycosyltransferase family 10 [Brachionus plicatilis]|uniref:Fucosyltransferase n=1 Tax=Brachionus plicatilis TaxID=10195 RepID=A0A3M7PSA8_BRAPC|nr:glycosyltransferase family 10 [Brachionus plicatilis]